MQITFNGYKEDTCIGDLDPIYILSMSFINLMASSRLKIREALYTSDLGSN